MILNSVLIENITFFEAHHGKFKKIIQILGSPRKSQAIPKNRTIQITFSDHNAVKL